MTKRSRPFPLLAAALAAALGLVQPAHAGQGVLVELFTSQGCNSCPPADRLLGRLAERDDVVPLSLHVTYWDYLGWRDTFAKDEFTNRQFAYREAMNARVVYTPQMIVQGDRDVPPSDREDIDRLIEAAAGNTGLRIEIAMEDGRLSARLAPGEAPAPGRIWVATYRRSARVDIARGENAGREFVYHNVVGSLMQMGDWAGEAPRTVELPQPGGGEGVAIWVQEGSAGPVRAAAKYEP